MLYDQAKALDEVFGSMKLIESVRPVLAGPQVFKLPDDPREAILVRYGIQRILNGTAKGNLIDLPPEAA